MDSPTDDQFIEQLYELYNDDAFVLSWESSTKNMPALSKEEIKDEVQFAVGTDSTDEEKAEAETIFPRVAQRDNDCV